jgi:hypothetical protein
VKVANNRAHSAFIPTIAGQREAQQRSQLHVRVIERRQFFAQDEEMERQMGRQMGRRMNIVFLCLTLALVVSGCGSTSISSAPAQTPTQPTIHYIATLSALNTSGVTGTAEMTLSGDYMDVTISLSGLAPNQQHMQHIHGAHGTHATCPTRASANVDGIITLAAGATAYGPVALPFEPTPTADADGKITWSRQRRLTPDDVFNIKTLTEHVVLIHGMTYKGLYDQTLPVACGPIKAA